MSAEPRPAERMPGWMHRAVECGPEFRKVEGLLDREGLNTVCVGARCPNRGECYSHGTATFMIMGDRCSRDCGFCAVPSGGLKPLDQGEPEAVARAAARLDLKHVVITSVTRDDIGDGGAGHFARTVRAVRAALPDAVVEVLVGDFQGRAEDIATVLAEEPEVFNHNLETVARLQEEVRPQADYGRSLEVIRQAAGAGLRAKSGRLQAADDRPVPSARREESRGCPLLGAPGVREARGESAGTGVRGGGRGAARAQLILRP
jgi:lipoic acid synthetase